MNVGIENYSHFASHLYQTSCKLSMKSRLRVLETLKIPYFLETTEHKIIDDFSMPTISCRPPALNNGLSNRTDLLLLKMRR